MLLFPLFLGSRYGRPPVPLVDSCQETESSRFCDEAAESVPEDEADADSPVSLSLSIGSKLYGRRPNSSSRDNVESCESNSEASSAEKYSRDDDRKTFFSEQLTATVFKQRVHRYVVFII